MGSECSGLDCPSSGLRGRAQRCLEKVPASLGPGAASGLSWPWWDWSLVQVSGKYGDQVPGKEKGKGWGQELLLGAT